MKINILTQPLLNNYGGILQNYALQEVLRRMGHEVVTVNVPPKSSIRQRSWKDYVKAVINLTNRVRGTYLCSYINPRTRAIKEHELSWPQRRFVGCYITKIDEIAPFKPELCERIPADAWIVGSDQIWRPWCSFYMDNCFFDFVPEGNTRRIAYAASFGTDQWEIDAETTARLRPLAAKFDAISVREISGVNLCRQYLGVESDHVLDPTMLLTAEDYLMITGEESTHPATPYIAQYVLDIDSSKVVAIRAESRRYKLPVHRVGGMHRNGFDSIESWIDGISSADRVITDSFHGTVFSIIFRKPVKILSNNVRGNARLDSLLTTLGLQIDDDGYYIVTDDVVHTIERLRDRSLSFLRNALK